MPEPLLTRKGLRTSLNPVDVQGAICHPMTLLQTSKKCNNVEVPRVRFSDLGLTATAKFVCKMVKIATWERCVLSQLRVDTFIFISFLALY